MWFDPLRNCERLADFRHTASVRQRFQQMSENEHARCALLGNSVRSLNVARRDYATPRER
jgi:hypothetical protein